MLKYTFQEAIARKDDSHNREEVSKETQSLEASSLTLLALKAARKLSMENYCSMVIMLS